MLFTGRKSWITPAAVSRTRLLVVSSSPAAPSFAIVMDTLFAGEYEVTSKED